MTDCERDAPDFDGISMAGVRVFAFCVLLHLKGGKNHVYSSFAVCNYLEDVILIPRRGKKDKAEDTGSRKLTACLLL